MHGILSRLEAVFKGFGYVRDDGEGEEPDLAQDIPLPFKPRAPKEYRRRGRSPSHPSFKQTDPDVMSIRGWCNLHFKYFSIHAGVAIRGGRPFWFEEIASLHIEVGGVAV